jgi:hypothetical protein
LKAAYFDLLDGKREASIKVELINGATVGRTYVRSDINALRSEIRALEAKVETEHAD